MSQNHRSIFRYVILSLFVFALAGCGSKESKWLGSYQSSQGQLQLKNDHKATLTMAGTSNDATWEMVNDDKIIVHFGIPIELFKTSTGLRDQEGTEWKKK
jgi:hypothetical protein